jgi:glycerophosphoryl diester phosphodiesterase
VSPLIFAHRGASAELPEHTLDAYVRAIEQGADGLECDVRLTRDGHLVCIHDSRLDRTSNGRGRVSGATLDELERLDFSSWHTQAGPGAPETVPAGVLTLDRLLSTVRAAGRPLRLLIETKHPSRYGSQVEERLVALLRKHDLVDASSTADVAVTVMSFSPLALRRLRTLAPDLPTVFLYELAPPAIRDGPPPFGAKILGPGLNVVKARPELVGRVHERGHQVYVWTVNEPDEIDLMLGLGVDGIISDRPAEVLSRLGR